jgi:hypothetical protein
VVDPFHVSPLATRAVGDGRRRVTDEAHGRRGRATDPAYTIRNLLVRGAETLSETARGKLAGHPGQLRHRTRGRRTAPAHPARPRTRLRHSCHPVEDLGSGHPESATAPPGAWATPSSTRIRTAPVGGPTPLPGLRCRQGPVAELPVYLPRLPPLGRTKSDDLTPGMFAGSGIDSMHAGRRGYI